MNTITPIWVFFILITLMWVLDDIFLYFIVELVITAMLLNQTDFFGTIAAGTQRWMDLTLIIMLVVAFAKHIYIINRARNKYYSIVGGQ